VPHLQNNSSEKRTSNFLAATPFAHIKETKNSRFLHSNESSNFENETIGFFQNHNEQLTLSLLDPAFHNSITCIL
jgi:hypothetical protein